MPPVWPRPRPDSCGTAAPHAATNGASGRVILSPTPPVECLSAVGRDTEDRSSRSPLAIIAAVQRALSAGVEPFPTSPQEFASYIREETKKWGDVVKAAIGPNAARDLRFAKRLIEQCKPVDPARLADAGVPMSKL